MKMMIMSPGATVRPCYLGMMFLLCTSTSSRGGSGKSRVMTVLATTTTTTSAIITKSLSRFTLMSSFSSVGSSFRLLEKRWSNNRPRVGSTAWILPIVQTERHAATKTTTATTTATQLLIASKRNVGTRRLPAIAAWTRITTPQPSMMDSASSIINESSLDHLPLITQQRWHAPPTNQLLIQWKGEAREGYSQEFRHLEFRNALEAVVTERNEEASSSSPLPIVEFTNALVYAGSTENMTEYRVEGFNQAFQYLHVNRSSSNKAIISLWQFRRAVERCALIRAMYEVVAIAETVSELAPLALKNDAFFDIQAQPRKLRKDPFSNNDNHKEESQAAFINWCIRVRHFHESSNLYDASSSSSSSDSGSGKERRYGARTTQSFSMERPVLKALTPLLLTFGGKVDLQNPDCKIYVFDGLEPDRCKMLARELAVGPKISFIAPASRICITTTPLCPIAAYLLCNVARIRDGDAVLDPFAGSCTTLLAATMMAPNCRTVGIEIAHNGEVNRDDVLLDFNTRNFQPPIALIHGDCTDALIRDEARAAIDTKSSKPQSQGAFDVIVTDPPYGIREKMSDTAAGLPTSPLEALFAAIAKDRQAGKPLLKRGGRLVAYCPYRPDENLEEILPTAAQTAEAGLVLFETREQKIRDTLSRWLVAYTAVLD